MDDPYSGQYAGSVFAILAVIYVVAILFVILASLAVYVLNGFAFMKLFRKVGIEPWAAWVPVFNIWRILELGGQAGWLSILAIIPYGSIVTVVFECIAVHRIGIAFRKTGTWVVLFIFLPFVWAFLIAKDTEVYDPELIRRAGYGPPLVGFGSAAYAANQYAKQQWAAQNPYPGSQPPPPAA